MSTTADDTEPTGDPAEEPEPSAAARPHPGLKKFREPTSKVAKAGWALYRHVAAILAAFALLALVRHFWDIGLKGVIATMAGVWDATIRPAMEFVFHVLVAVPLSWVGVDFEVPLWLRDYLAVGAVLSLSYFRTARGRQLPGLLDYYGFVRYFRPNRRKYTLFSAKPKRVWLAVAYIIVLWPIILTLTLTIGIGGSALLVQTKRTSRRQRPALAFPGYDFDNPLSYWRKAIRFNPWSEFVIEAYSRSAVRQEPTSRAIFDLAVGIMMILSPLFYLSLLLIVNQFL